MGKRIELTEVFRPKRPSFMGSQPRKDWQVAKNAEARQMLDAIEALGHKRAVKAAQMRRYRAKKSTPDQQS